MLVRYQIQVHGIVQGVGFRPFIYVLAEELGLTGWIYNHAAGVTIEIQGEETVCREFQKRLQTDRPALSRIDQVESQLIPVQRETEFVIRESRSGEKNTLVSPDMGVCDDCLQELWDPSDRRYRYAFINCTNCGPRFTIIENLPYDRPMTTMKDFPLCSDCAREYRDPHNRRFHAQPVACPVCGPQLAFLDKGGQAQKGDPISLAQDAIRAGRILAVKGLGGYHLVCDAKNEEAVAALRQRKYRWDKPFALMLADEGAVSQYCLFNLEEEELLRSQRRPIVLLRKDSKETDLAPSLAPGNGRLGVMLPYTPLHYLLMEGMDALVMTSGNISDEPIVFQDQEAVERLSVIADGFLTHNRPIFRRCDDSVVQWSAGGLRLVRRARGYTPEPISILDSGRAILACGGEQKNTFCLTRSNQAFISQHIGDLQNIATLESFQREIGYFCTMFNVEPQVLAYDLHPDYLSTRYALEQGGCVKKLGVQHHHAHLASVLAEHDHHEAVIGLIFDGTGYGTDGCLWGGEVLIGDCCTYQRAAHLGPLPLPGGEQAIREPWRVGLAAAILALPREELESALPQWLRPMGWQTLVRIVEQGIYAPVSTGMGRLFDAVAAIAGVGVRVNYEGQAAVELEQLLDERIDGRYCFTIQQKKDAPWVVDQRPVIRAALEDIHKSVAPGGISVRFHRAVVDLCREICSQLRDSTGLHTVALSGGCWQNVWLLEHTVESLREAGFNVLLNQRVPCNDGGLSYGQAAVAAARLMRGD